MDSVAKADDTINAVNKGNFTFKSDNSDKINDVLVCNNLSFNLISVWKLEEKNFKIFLKNLV